MHEIALCESLLRIIEEQAAIQHFRKVKTVWLALGSLSCVEKGALQFGFDVVVKDSLAESATLEIIDVPGIAWCFDCGKNVKLQHRLDSCPLCDGRELQLMQGDELRITEIEVE